MWWKIILLIAVGLAVAVASGYFYGPIRWRGGIKSICGSLEASRLPVEPKTYDPKETEGLPAPVQRYFRTVLKEGRPLVAAVRIEHTGSFSASGDGDSWEPFTSTQHVLTRRRGFVWNARIRMAPGMPVFVQDSYLKGKGFLTAKLLGLLTVMKQPDTPELAQGELMRFFAEAAWYPTALLPSQGVRWEAIDEIRARATLTDGETTVGLIFQFDALGRIVTVYSDGRYRLVDGEQVATPWQGRFWDYESRGGMLIPIEGEVAWVPPEGPKPYWRGRIQRIEYEFAR